MKGSEWNKNGMSRTYYSPQEIANETGHAETGADMSAKHLLKAILKGKFYEENGKFFVKDVTGHMTDEFIAEAHALFSAPIQPTQNEVSSLDKESIIFEVESDMFETKFNGPAYYGLSEI